MALPETELARARRWCEGRIPFQLRDEVRIEVDVSRHALTIFECRQPWRPELGPTWSRFPVARFRYSAKTKLWALYWRDRNLRFHRYDLCPPSPHLAVLLDEVDRDPTGIFWG